MIIDPYSNLHLYGHYKVGNNIYYSKIDAMADHVKSSNPITWHIMEDELKELNITVEPTETLEELYAERARKIRERYDYIVIHFSGGTDSSKVVDIFYRNGIKVDEIFHRTYSRIERKNAALTLGDPEAVEPEVLTNPRLDFIKTKLWPDVNIRQLDISQDMIQSFNKGNWFEEGKPPGTEILAPWRQDWEISVPEWLKMADKGIKIGHIIGKDKPLVYKDKIGYYITFIDNIVNSWIMPKKKFAGYPSYKEFFFTHPESAKIIVKQAHLLKKNLSDQEWLFDHHRHTMTRKRENIIADVIYGETVFKNNTTTLKDGDREIPFNLGRMTSGTGWWITKDFKSEQFKHYSAGLRDMYSEIKPFYENFIDFYQKGLPKFLTKKHYISYHNV